MLPSQPMLEPVLIHNPGLLLFPQLALPRAPGMSRNWPFHQSLNLLAALPAPLQFPYLHSLPPIGELLELVEEQTQVCICHPSLRVEVEQVQVFVLNLQGQELGAVAAVHAPLEVEEEAVLPLTLALVRDAGR